MTTGQRIRIARKSANMTQAELAQKLDIPFQSISQWERDARNPKLETLQRIADALQVPLVFLLDGITEDAYYAGFDLATALEQGEQQYFDALRKEKGYTFSNNEVRLIKSFSTLSDEGQAKAVERVEELTEIPKYQKKPPQD